jgi:ribosomal small subunit protein bTHX
MSGLPHGVLTLSPAHCSQGDKRTAKGKRRAGTHGVCRPTNAALRIRRDGPMSASPAPAPSAPAPAPAPAPSPPPAPAPAAAPEPEPAAAAPAAALSAGELMKLVKALKADLPRAEMKQCKQALEATGGDVAAAKASIEAEMASTWAAEDEAKQVSIKEGSTVLMEMRDAKAKKKFEEAEAKAAE